MRTEPSRNPKASWPKLVVKKWLNLKAGGEEFRSEYYSSSKASGAVQERRKSCSDKDAAVFRRRDRSGRTTWLVGTAGEGNLKPPRSVAPSAHAAEDSLRVFVGTWNVGGKAPHGGLNLGRWLSTPAPADIYVLGFQEIVPLNAGNVLGAEDRGPATKWLSLISQALNPPRRPSTFAAGGSCGHVEMPRFSFSDFLSLEDTVAEAEEEQGRGWRGDGDDSEELGSSTSPTSSDEGSPQVFPIGSTRRGGGGRYRLVVSKQMVGIFLCVWVRSELLYHVTGLGVSCVGRGIMGYMGNKGSISISMTLPQTTFCFVCTHLTSGEKDGDEIRRNLDVSEILKRTRFPRPRHLSRLATSPATILEHDKVIWLGDLNYRLAPGGGNTVELLQRNDWQALLEKDQLRIEQRAGRVFTGWEEGRIHFPPTYKYLANSDSYAMQPAKSREKRRAPAWCDRILWRGKGMKQVCYVRGESRFSDHRPVYSIFSVRVGADAVDLDDDRADANSYTGPGSRSSSDGSGTGKCGGRWPIMATGTGIGSANSCARVQAEELFLLTRTHSCLGASRF